MLTSYTLIAIATGLIGYETATASGVRRRQGAALIVASLPPLFGNFLYTFGAIDTNATTLGFFLLTLIFGWALFYANFLNAAPVGRRRVYEQMADPAVTVDTTGRVVDSNAAARSLLDIDSELAQITETEFFERLPDSLAERIATGDVLTDAEVTISVDGETRHFLVSYQPLGETGDATLGWFMLLRDVTAQKRRENELDLMRQVQSRVLRHNIKNKLTAMAGHAELVATEVDGETHERARRVVDAADDLLSTSEKARYVERLVEASREPEQLELCSVLADIVSSTEQEHPEVSVELQCRRTTVEAIPALTIAFENLIENAAEHNEGQNQTVTVTVSADSDSVVVSVADNGPGIPDQELSVIERGAEIKLYHGSGIGLWVINWAVENSAATLTYQTDEDGTDAVITIPTGAA